MARGNLCVWVRARVCVEFSMRPYTVTTSSPAKSTLFSACECPSTYGLYSTPWARWAIQQWGARLTLDPLQSSSTLPSLSHSLITRRTLELLFTFGKKLTCEATQKSGLGAKHCHGRPGWNILSLAISPSPPSTAQWDRCAHRKTNWLFSSSLCNIYFQLFDWMLILSLALNVCTREVKVWNIFWLVVL